VFLVIQDDGRLVARTIDGSVNRELVAKYETITFEPRLDLVWLSKNGSADVLDLREDSPKVHRIVKLPKTIAGMITVRWILGGEEAVTDMANGYGVGVLDWSAHPAFERADPEDDERGYKIVDRAWLVAQLDRKTNELPVARFPTKATAQ